MERVGCSCTGTCDTSALGMRKRMAGCVAMPDSSSESMSKSANTVPGAGIVFNFRPSLLSMGVASSTSMNVFLIMNGCVGETPLGVPWEALESTL